MPIADTLERRFTTGTQVVYSTLSGAIGWDRVVTVVGHAEDFSLYDLDMSGGCGAADVRQGVSAWCLSRA